ncbi:MAG: adenylate/guanylate cyclase domain-containing protein, partial [Anaerolineales bacterium]|nr:adenylate/guanylate cyclase domain-containing protein [Anaerolineales bacterium]
MGGSSEPDGLTFLFTDLEGSTALWEAYPAAMRPVLARHDAILREAVEAHFGRVVKMTGDGLHAVFDSASKAVAAALEAQIALLDETWPDPPGPLRVRMGIHSGESEAREGDFYGPEVNRAARVMAIGHGGQVLISGASAALAGDQLPPAASFIDLGEHGLRDLLNA